MKYYIESWKRWCDFKGRSSRKEFWISHLFDIIIICILLIFGFLLVYGYVFARLLSFIALSIRRLHDTNRSGWWLFIILLPIGQIILLIYYLEDSYIGENEYGKNPKE